MRDRRYATMLRLADIEPSDTVQATGEVDAPSRGSSYPAAALVLDRPGRRRHFPDAKDLGDCRCACRRSSMWIKIAPEVVRAELIYLFIQK